MRRARRPASRPRSRDRRRASRSPGGRSRLSRVLRCSRCVPRARPRLSRSRARRKPSADPALDDSPLHVAQRRRLAAVERGGRLRERQARAGQHAADQWRHVGAADAARAGGIAHPSSVAAWRGAALDAAAADDRLHPRRISSPLDYIRSIIERLCGPSGRRVVQPLPGPQARTPTAAPIPPGTRIRRPALRRRRRHRRPAASAGAACPRAGGRARQRRGGGPCGALPDALARAARARPRTRARRACAPTRRRGPR